MEETMPLSINDRLAAALQTAARIRTAPQTAAATTTQAQTEIKETPKVATQQEQELEEAAKSREAFAAKIKENPFYQAFEENSQLTQEEQINLLANALDPKQHTKEELEKSYELAEEYFTHLQSDELQRILEGVTRNVQELKDQEKIENRKA